MVKRTCNKIFIRFTSCIILRAESLTNSYVINKLWNQPARLESFEKQRKISQGNPKGPKQLSNFWRRGYIPERYGEILILKYGRETTITSYCKLHRRRLTFLEHFHAC